MKNEFDGIVERLLRGNIFMQEAIELLEKGMIEGALRANEGNQSVASKQLGIHRNTLQRKMRDYGLDNGRSHQRRKPLVREARARKRKTA
jgi:Fis family transcriptional regulator, factor for inversion stimulation protein